ncbi:MAG: ATP synthase subunit I [Halofilum sp. (in: g-proteobacteria)]|nr:ATP synthase subunit I [Halofilum sp. (in: g-proteobacteria)]
MPNRTSAEVRHRLLGRMAGSQALVVLAATAISAAIGGPEWALASALGGGACLLAQTWFVWRMFRAGPGDSPHAMMAAFYQGEMVKLALIVVILIVIFRAWPAVPLAPLVLTFIAVQAVHWFAPLLLER